MFTLRFQQWVRRRAQAVAAWLARLPITPNQVTVAGMLVVFVAAVLVATGHLLAAGVVLAFGGSFDILDGALARVTKRSYPYGAFLDSTTDRYAEAAVYVGLAAYYVGQPNPRPAVLGVLLAMVGSLTVSYVRARAQSLGFKCDSGLFARPERIVATIVGLVIGGWVLFWIIWALAALTNLTALQRVAEVWRQARAQRQQAATAVAAPAEAAPAEVVPQTPSRRPRTAKQKLAPNRLS
ncbi:MAG TPA: CDP-alcohol phosphatidyltransferase family protein [Candidatus Dormibacteraeota bacterium]|nr:CDP-alcohol phosphatidyltransferase family protein [Candidatus Dormibacteraeota bacterium]